MRNMFAAIRVTYPACKHNKRIAGVHDILYLLFPDLSDWKETQCEGKIVQAHA
jgi:hypothetical protein